MAAPPAEEAALLNLLRSRYRLAAWLALLLSGCASLPAPAAPRPARLPFRLQAEFTSCLPDVYVVLSGPAESYERFRLNDRFRVGISELARLKSTEDSPRTASLIVHLDRFATGYDQLGADHAPPPRPPRYALAVAPGAVQSASASSVAEWAWGGGERDLSIPAEIRKSATATLAVAVHFLQGGEIRHDTLQTEYRVVITRDQYDRRWAYDYGPVLDGLVRRAVEQIDRFLDEAAKALPEK